MYFQLETSYFVRASYWRENLANGVRRLGEGSIASGHSFVQLQPCDPSHEPGTVLAGVLRWGTGEQGMKVPAKRSGWGPAGKACTRAGMDGELHTSKVAGSETCDRTEQRPDGT